MKILVLCSTAFSIICLAHETHTENQATLSLLHMEFHQVLNVQST